MNDEDKALIVAAVGGCREELGEEAAYDKCWAPAEFVLWGKLFPPEALGPRCYEHARSHITSGDMSLQNMEQWAVVDLRPLLR